MKTFSAKPAEAAKAKKWVLVDADGVAGEEAALAGAETWGEGGEDRAELAAALGEGRGAVGGEDLRQ